MKITVITDQNIEGFHFYKDAPQEVDFLQLNHRHIFRIRAGFRVTHADRETEIFIMQRRIKDFITKKYGEPAVFKTMSCEMIASAILLNLSTSSCQWVEVLEDGLGGGKVEL